jgi:chromosome partitioning protein
MGFMQNNGKGNNVKTKIICVANQKGGVGKTTTAVNLSAGLSILKKSVLIVDCDAQGNATSGLGIDRNNLNKHLYHAILGLAKPSEVISPTTVANLFIIPSNMDLVGIEADLATRNNKEFIFKKVLDPLRSFDYIILDCPPSLGLITINALSASDSVIIPMQCEYYALEGLSQLLKIIRIVKYRFNPRLHIEGLLLTMYDYRIRLAFQVAREVRTHFRGLVYKTTVPRNIKLSESPSHGKSIFSYEPKSKGAESYFSLAREFLSCQRRS